MARDRKGTVWRLLHGSRRLKVALYFLVFAGQIVFYTLIFHHAYPLLEGKTITWPASLLFVLETITTVGYGDLLPFTNQYTVALTILMMVSGIIQLFMVIPLLLVPYIGSHLQPSPPQRISHEISGHIVIIGYSPITRALIESLLITELPLVIVVDKKETAFFLSDLFRKRVYVIWGSYQDNATWEGAWVKKARDVVVCEEEQTTASIILGIRALTEARIVAVVDKLSFERYLRYAGADTVLSPKHATGQILARHVALTSHVDTLVEETVVVENGVQGSPRPRDPLRIINIPVLEGSRAAGLRLGELELPSRFGAECLLISRRGHFSFFPGPGEVLDTSTMLFLLTRMSSIEKMVAELFLPAGKTEVLGVITGFGDVGRSAYRELTALGMECMVIDQRPYPVNIVVGKAEDEETLQEARIRDADFCIVALNDDARNILTTLMARNQNPRIRILARANDPASVDKLARAGADYVALLPSIGGQIVAGVLLADTVYIILSLPNGQVIVRRRYTARTPETVSSLEKKCAVRVLGIQRMDESVIFPDGETFLRAGDVLLVMGLPRGLRKFIRVTQRDLL
ncbi:MAG: NAD-binding protein [Methanolinea sp.]|nr:NAD-binding protein [Methanolinea sp.]